ncbi:hypothetical protein [Streptomyces sp. NBC_00448]|uniref:hypothetical protein n=1 Tax=Streptomyces sp. NBC_00448 TaxID=2903652 RepID=UPI002E235624
MHRDDALARARLAVAGDLLALLRADPQLTSVREVFEWAVGHAGGGDLDEDCLWSDESARLGPPIGRPRPSGACSPTTPESGPAPPDRHRPVRHPRRPDGARRVA